MRKSAVAILIVAVIRLCNPAMIGAQETFYKGKTIRLIVGSTSWFWNRMERRTRLRKAGAARAALAATGVGIVQYNIYMDQLVGRKEVQFDVRKFGWIGSPASETVLLYMRKDAPYKSIRDIVKAKEAPKCGSSGTVSTDYLLAKLLEDAIGAKFNTVLGYPGGAEIDIAVEKGEVVCRAHNISAHFGREPFNSWHKKDFDRHIVQTGGKRDARLPDTPTIYELFDEYKSSDVSRRVAQVMLTGGDLGRPMLVTPGTPAERLKILREAYLRSFKDTELLVETEKAKMDVDPTPGEELEALIKKVMDQPQEVTERVKKMLAN